MLASTRKKMVVVLCLVFAGLIVSGTRSSVSYDVFSGVEASQINIQENVTLIHQTGFNNSADIYGLQSPSFEVYVAIGNESNAFPLSLIIIERDYIGVASVTTKNGTMIHGKIKIDRIFMISFPLLFLYNGTGSAMERKFLHNESLRFRTWDTEVTRRSINEYGLNVETQTRFGVIGFNFHVNLSPPKRESVSFLNITSDTRSGATQINKQNKTMILQDITVKIDHYFHLNSTGTSVILPVEVRILQLLNPLSSFLLYMQREFHADMDVANKTDEANPELRQTPLRVKDLSGVPLEMAWISTALVNGDAKNVRFYIQRKWAEPLRVTWRDQRFIGTSTYVKAFYRYPFGTEIIHDPSVEAVIRFDDISVLIRSFFKWQSIGELVGLVIFTLIAGKALQDQVKIHVKTSHESSE